MEDNGMCWMTKGEFFKYFPSIYLSAFNMARLQDANYVNDLEDEFPRRKGTEPKVEEEKKEIEEPEINEGRVEPEEQKVEVEPEAQKVETKPSAKREVEEPQQPKEEVEESEIERKKKLKEKIKGGAMSVAMLKKQMEGAKSKRGKGSTRASLENLAGMSQVELMKQRFQNK